MPPNAFPPPRPAAVARQRPGPRRSEAMFVRPALPRHAEAIAQVYVESWRHAYRGIVPDAVLDGMCAQRESQRWRRHLGDMPPGCCAFIAGRRGEVLGFATMGPARGRPTDAEVFTLYLLPSAQRQGVGRKLMAACAEQLLAEGFTEGQVEVLKANSRARRFYEMLGGVPVCERDVPVGKGTLPVVRYHWGDLAALEEQAARLANLPLPDLPGPAGSP